MTTPPTISERRTGLGSSGMQVFQPFNRCNNPRSASELLPTVPPPVCQKLRQQRTLSPDWLPNEMHRSIAPHHSAVPSDVEPGRGDIGWLVSCRQYAHSRPSSEVVDHWANERHYDFYTFVRQ